MAKSALEDRFAAASEKRGMRFEREHRWAVVVVGAGEGVRARLVAAGLKDTRFDFALPELKIAVELNGGEWMYGKHQRGYGASHDAEKCNEATRRGWAVFTLTGTMVREELDRWLDVIEEVVRDRRRAVEGAQRL
jgi:very-short-patch-repair endonuclease